MHRYMQAADIHKYTNQAEEEKLSEPEDESTDNYHSDVDNQ